MKVVVTGGRNYTDRNRVFYELDSLPISHLYVGDATGADAFALEWAKLKNIPYTMLEAKWDKYGKRAGSLRNGALLIAAGREATVVAFPGRRGTANCISQATDMGMKVIRICLSKELI